MSLLRKTQTTMKIFKIIILITMLSILVGCNGKVKKALIERTTTRTYVYQNKEVKEIFKPK